ncbi:hypothetical protein F5I97DRAFT_1403613 [Phlebopus sp. FC_14]|nr:hypothetical protein F5I97DRAFT_1403613 [Phlebopus sp. FC_14]
MDAPQPPQEKIPSQLQLLGYKVDLNILEEYARARNLSKGGRTGPSPISLTVDAINHISAQLDRRLEYLSIRTPDGSFPFLAIAANYGHLAGWDTEERRQLLQSLLEMSEGPQWFPINCRKHAERLRTPTQLLGYKADLQKLQDYAKARNLSKGGRTGPSPISLTIDAINHISAQLDNRMEYLSIPTPDGSAPFLAIAADRGWLAGWDSEDRRQRFQSILEMNEGPKWWPYRRRVQN